MNTAFTTTGHLLNNHTIELDENITFKSKNVKIIIEPVEEPIKKERQFGCLKGKLIMKPDFNEPLDDFKEYMQ